MIDEQTKNIIIQTASIVEVLNDFITLKKKGANYMGLCPFHNEKSPSFTVSPSKEFYKCFGCGKSGSVINFLMDYLKLSYPESLKWLAKKYNIPVIEKERTPEQIQEKFHQESLYILNEFAQKYYSDQLYLQTGSDLALDYLNYRGILKITCEKFLLGYAPPGYDNFYQAAIKNQYSHELLIKSGLVGKKNNTYYDSYRDRIIFPICNLSNRVVGFGARIIQPNPNTAKYINTPENELYIKNSILYGIHLARQPIIQQDECILVEGYTDVIRLHQSGIENVVSSSGTALSPNQLNLIKKFTKNIVIIYDGDPAGIKAAVRGLDLAIEENMNVNLVLLPEPEDPDSFVGKVGADGFKTYILEHKKDFLFFLIDLHLEEVENDINAKNQLVTQIAEILSKMNRLTDFVKQDYYINRCAQKLQIDNQALSNLVGSMTQKRSQSKNQKFKVTKDNINETLVEIDRQRQAILNETVSNVTSESIYEKRILTILVEYGLEIWEANVTTAQYILSNIEQFPVETPEFIEFIDFYKQEMSQNKFPNFKNLFTHENETIRQTAKIIAPEIVEVSDYWHIDRDKIIELIEHVGDENTKIMYKENLLGNKDETAKHHLIVDNYLRHYIMKKIKKLLDNLTQKLRDPILTEEEQKEILHTQLELKKYEKEIAVPLGTVLRK